jgi:aspartate/methionine/tyrosine aminotransferase
MVNALDGSQQYSPSQGNPALLKALEKKYKKVLNTPITTDNIIIGVGASQMLFACMMTYLNKNDEVLAFGPSFDIYENQVKLSNGIYK